MTESSDIEIKRNNQGGRGGILLSILLVLCGWSLIVVLGDFPEFILPTPLTVAHRFVRALTSGQLIRHSLVTLTEVIVGLSGGTVFAVTTGYLLHKSKPIEKLLSPVLVASQAIPVVAIAPLLVIWFGPGLLSKILVCAIIVFFPVLVSTLIGLRNVPTELHDLMRTYRAGPMKILRYLEIPATLPIFLGGMRIGATLSVTGAVVGEFLGADRGLGFLINVARGQYDTALVFVVIIVLVVMALSLYHLVMFVERKILKWKVV